MSAGLVTRVELDAIIYDVQTEDLNQRYQTVFFRQGSIVFTHAEDAPASSQINTQSFLRRHHLEAIKAFRDHTLS